jgi:hypothetical protein
MDTPTLFEIPNVSKAKHNVQRMNGARNNRVLHDFYPTPEIATVSFLERERFSGEISEPACGDGAISKVLERYGYTVKSTDLIDRGYGTGGIDFLRTHEMTDNIVTNPPFSLGPKFVHHALTHTHHKVAMLLRLGFLETKSRKKLFTEHPFCRLYVFCERVPFSSNNAIAFGWFVWDHDFKGTPTIEWL